MATVTFNIPDHLVEDFCGWFSNSGEQDLMEAHLCQHDDTFISVEGYGIDEPITIVEYNKETDERLS